MADYTLYYWPVPFRGQFIRAILAFAGKSWEERDAEAIGALMDLEPSQQPVPFVGPPVLIDHSRDFALSQMSAIATYLADTLELVASAEHRAMTIKITNDANDVIDELTLDGGREMWTAKKWEEFTPRLEKWMSIWEATAARNGVEKERGYLLGTDEAGVADVVTATLWSTMADRFPPIAAMLDKVAPRTAGLTRRMQALPALAELKERSFEMYGQAYCGGEIEKSLRKVLGVKD